MSTPEPLDWNDLAGDVPSDIEDDTPAPVARPAREAEPDTSLRARILAHPDLAERLCDPPLSYSRPECWTGYVPSETWQGQRNDSTRRLQLVGIVAELEGREKAAAGEADKAQAQEVDA